MVHTWNSELRGVVELPGGRSVRGRALRSDSPAGDEVPEYGLYLTSRPHEEQWESRWVEWPDFRLPRVPSEAIAAIEDAYARSAAMKVEIACGGGKGRTGTAIAILARYAGVPAEDAVAWVRAQYRAGAVETPWQRRFVRQAVLDR
jgi:protein-tyrosine phosphatase